MGFIINSLHKHSKSPKNANRINPKEYINLITLKSDSLQRFLKHYLWFINSLCRCELNASHLVKLMGFRCEIQTYNVTEICETQVMLMKYTTYLQAPDRLICLLILSSISPLHYSHSTILWQSGIKCFVQYISYSFHEASQIRSQSFAFGHMWIYVLFCSSLESVFDH